MKHYEVRALDPEHHCIQIEAECFDDAAKIFLEFPYIIFLDFGNYLTERKKNNKNQDLFKFELWTYKLTDRNHMTDLSKNI